MAKNEMTVMTLGEAISSPMQVSLYGKLIAQSVLGPQSAVTFSHNPGIPAVAQIHSFKIGPACIRLPKPVLMGVPGDGQPAGADTCAHPEDSVWKVNLFDRSFALTQSAGTIEELLDEVSTKGISGGLRFENPRIENGRACVDVHIWAKIEIFGGKVDFDERFPICIPLEGCHTLWEGGFANLQVCFRAPNQLCGKLCVGKWGLEKCWDHCVTLPFATAAGVGGAGAGGAGAGGTGAGGCGCQPQNR